MNVTLKDPAAAKIDWPRHLARLSIIAAVACCLIQVAYAQLIAKEKSPEWSSADRVVSAVGIAMLLSGTTLGLTALTAAIRRSNYDTGVIAVIGLFINGGLLALIAWWVLIVRPSLPLE